MVAISPAELAKEASSENKVTFRWVYILLPVIILAVSIITTAFFYHRLPPELAYRFTDDIPDRWMSRGAIIAWLLIPQFILTLLALVVVRTAIFSTRYWSVESTPLKKVLPVMGNMVVLPQVILAFAMLDVFLYNAYQTRLIPLWVFALMVMVLGVIILGIFFIQTIRQTRQSHGKSHQE